ncbi:unnamed protein product, partial [Rotaria sp. Silwood1]
EHKYADRVVQQFSSKEKIVLEIIKDLRLFVGGSLREFSNHNSQQKYAGRVVQQFSPKEKIALEIIKDLRLFVGGSLREFSNHNSRLPNKLVFS